MKVSRKISIFFLIGLIYSLSSASSGQTFSQIINNPEANKLICIIYKINGNRYILEDGIVEYQGKPIAKTKKSCFSPPAKLCNRSQSINLVFKPYNIYKYYKITIALKLKGVRSKNQKSKNLRCIPIGKSSYPRDYIYAKIPNGHHLQKLKTAIPYVKNVQIKDSFLHKKILPYIENCSTNDKTCLIYKTYQQVTSRLKYKSDPYLKIGDLIRTPRETLKNGGGDCEDLTGVLVSFLANLKIKSYVIMTDTHAYAMACGVNKEQLKVFIKKGLETYEKKSEKFTLRKGQIRSFSFSQNTGNKSKAFKWKISTRSKDPFNLYVMNRKINITQDNYNNLPINKKCSRNNITYYSLPCILTLNDQIVLDYGKQKNEGSKNIILDIEIKDNNAEYIKDFSINYFEVKKLGKDRYCVILESTAGKQGYPGFSKQNKGSPIAIDPVTWDWFYLKQ